MHFWKKENQILQENKIVEFKYQNTIDEY